jgi:Asp-tRNA(Asn)/Glu-tRNA(Gln) amidotransferase A subunit family amidase
MSRNELVELTAAEIAEHVRRRVLSPLAIVHACLDRIAETESELQAWEHVDADGALDAARRLEARLARGRRLTSPMIGVPIGVKDVIDVRGMVTAMGLPSRRAAIAGRDASVVARLRRAGAIVLGKMVTTQLAYLDPARTRNPRTPDRTPGGSSSGPAVGVAARSVPLAVATQTGGSTLRPAAFNGVVGFKPSQGLVPTRGLAHLSRRVDQVGVIARTVADVALFLDVTASATPPTLPPYRKDPPQLAVVGEAVAMCGPDVRTEFEAAVMTLEAVIGHCRNLDAPLELERLLELQRTVVAREAADAYGALLAGAELEPKARELVRNGLATPRRAYHLAIAEAARIRARVLELTASYDALVAPAVPEPAPPPSSTGSSAVMAPFTLLGFGAIAVPTGVGRDGLPMAVQLICAPGRDRALLDIAARAEALFAPIPPPDIPRWARPGDHSHITKESS